MMFDWSMTLPWNSHFAGKLLQSLESGKTTTLATLNKKGVMGILFKIFPVIAGVIMHNLLNLAPDLNEFSFVHDVTF